MVAEQRAVYMAERLSAEPDARVLVLEAGTDGRNDLRIRIPAALIIVNARAQQLEPIAVAG